MKRAMSGWGLGFVGMSLVVSACSSAPVEQGSATESAITEPAQLNGFHMMPLTVPGVSAPPVTEAAPVRLTYYGGPVIPAVKVYAVYWGSRVNHQAHLNAFYASVTNSNYFDWLSEYNTPTQTIGRGTFGGGFVITPSSAATRVTDAVVQAEISAQMDAGVLPQTDGVNSLYMLHFPPGITLVAPDNESTSCTKFCAYHGTYKKNDQYVFYGIHPDLQSAGCSFGCGFGSPQDNITTVASHELIEAVTDAAVGLAKELAPPLSWYNEQKGEVGDICNGQSARINNFAVQKQWSNVQNRCTAQ
jgi:hypothetical protein